MFSGGKRAVASKFWSTIIINRPEKGAGVLRPPKYLVPRWKLIANWSQDSARWCKTDLLCGIFHQQFQKLNNDGAGRTGMSPIIVLGFSVLLLKVTTGDACNNCDGCSNAVDDAIDDFVVLPVQDGTTAQDGATA
jgi:hypothetical protein